MSKLHQLLAVHDSSQTTFKRVAEEAVATFTKKTNLFDGLNIVTKSLLDTTDSKYLEYPDTTHHVPVAETVEGKLHYIAEHATNFFDINLQIDVANCSAKSDLIVDGNVLASNVPATSLLFLENKMKTIRGVIEATPTLDPAIEWKTSQQAHISKAPDSIKPIFEVVKEHVIATQATDKHPAQYYMQDKRVNRATATSTVLSGRTTSQRKSELIAKCDKIINACKQARQRANEVEHTKDMIGGKIFEYLLK